MGRLYIVCKSKKEESKVLEELRKQGKVWAVSKRKPTERSFFRKEYREFGIMVYENGYISWTVDVPRHIECCEGGEKISAAEFLKKNKETIVIYRNGDETIALEKNTGRKAVAKCNTDDTYSFEIGAKLALKRLFPEPAREVSRHAEVGEFIKIVNPIGAYGKYKKGDIFRVKEAFPETKLRCQSVRCYDCTHSCIRHDEYVVLENYQPEEEPQEKQEQYYTGKVVCAGLKTSSRNAGYTVGRIYEIKDGKLWDDDGHKRPMSGPIKRLEDYKPVDFIEIVE